MYCCEARFFNDDHDGRITLSNGSSVYSPSTTNTSNTSHASSSSFDQIKSCHHIRAASSMEFNKTLKFDRILSSFSVQAKVIEFIRHWMQRYWDKDWCHNKKLVSYCKGFGRRIRGAYESDDNWDPLEVQKGFIYLI